MAGFGGAVKLTGESEYKAALKSITQNLKEVSSEMKVVTSLYGKNDTSIAAMTAKQDVLNKKLTEQKSKLSTLKAEYAAMETEFKANTKAHDDLVESYNDESAKLKQLEATVGTASAEYKAQEKVVAELEKELMKSSAAQEANEKTMSQMRIAINNAEADINKTTKELDSLETALKESADEGEDLGDAMEDAGDSAEKAKGGFTVLKGALADLVSSAIQEVTSAMKDLVKEAISSSDALYKFEQTMGFAGYDSKAIDKAKADMKDYADKTVYDLDTVSNTTAQLAANGIKDYTGLTQAAGNLNAVAGGNADTFKSVAMVMTQTAGAGKLTTENWNQLADAIPGASGKIQEALKKNGAYTGDFREAMAKGEITADEFNAAIMELGNEPIAVEAAQSVATFEGAMGNLEATFVNGFMEIYDTIGRENITGIINNINDVVEKMLDGLKTGIQWVVDNGNTIIAVLTGMATGVASYVAYTTALTVMKEGWMALTVVEKAAAAGQAILNAVMAANPIGILIAAIAALVAAFTVLWNTNEGFREAVLKVWEAIKTGVTNAVTAMKEFLTGAFEAIKTGITTAWNNVKTVTLTIWEGLKAAVAGAIQNVKDSINAAMTAIKTIVTTIWNAIKAATSATWNAISTATSTVWNAIKTAITTVVNGIKSVVSSTFNGIKTTITSVWNAVKSATSTAWNGIKSAITTPINAAKEAVKSAIDKIKSIVNGAKLKLPHIKLPHFSISGKFSLNPPSIPKVSVDWYETGGVFDRPTVAGLAENGTEAIVPLERNTMWIKRVADELAGFLMPIGGLSDTLNALSNPANADYNYNRVVDAFKDALSQMTVELDDDQVGKFVIRTVENAIYT